MMRNLLIALMLVVLMAVSNVVGAEAPNAMRIDLLKVDYQPWQDWRTNNRQMTWPEYCREISQLNGMPNTEQARRHIGVGSFPEGFLVPWPTGRTAIPVIKAEALKKKVATVPTQETPATKPMENYKAFLSEEEIPVPTVADPEKWVAEMDKAVGKMADMLPDFPTTPVTMETSVVATAPPVSTVAKQDNLSQAIKKINDWTETIKRQSSSNELPVATATVAPKEASLVNVGAFSSNQAPNNSNQYHLIPCFLIGFFLGIVIRTGILGKTKEYIAASVMIQRKARDRIKQLESELGEKELIIKRADQLSSQYCQIISGLLNRALVREKELKQMKPYFCEYELEIYFLQHHGQPEAKEALKIRLLKHPKMERNIFVPCGHVVGFTNIRRHIADCTACAKELGLRTKRQMSEATESTGGGSVNFPDDTVVTPTNESLVAGASSK